MKHLFKETSFEGYFFQKRNYMYCFAGTYLCNWVVLWNTRELRFKRL